ncbi:MAG: AI-2E family transporter [Candidatus Binatia bacterium]
MDGFDVLRAAKLWLGFTAAVLAVAVLYWAQPFIVPLALALLITFFLSPIVSRLQPWVGKVPAVLVVVALTFSVIGLAGYAASRQLGSLVLELPAYRANIIQKVRDIRGASQGGSVEKVQEAVNEIAEEVGGTAASTSPQPVVVASEQTSSLWGFPSTLGSIMGVLGDIGLVAVLVVFMLLERQELRNRLVRLLGHKHLTIATRAFDEAGQRVSRYLLMQSLVNAVFATGVGIGLYLIGVPYVLLWASLAFALRFIPYVGSIISAVAPLLVSLAVLEGWTRPLLVLALYLGLELFTNMVLETVLYAGAAGVSELGLITAVAFWTWLWGPLGLLLATPLTVCLVVLGKYVPGLQFIATLMSDEPALAPDKNYYQRLLAGDQSEAADLLDAQLKRGEVESAYDALLLPALNYAERDRIEGRLTDDEERAIVETTRELLVELAHHARAVTPDAAAAAGAGRIAILGWPANGEADGLALRMLAQLLDGTPFALEILAAPMLSAEVVSLVQERGCRAICIADLPPSAPLKTRYLIRRLRAAAPDLTIVVGRWAPPALADDGDEGLLAAGADHVGKTLLETRQRLLHLTGLLTHGASRADERPARVGKHA